MSNLAYTYLVFGATGRTGKHFVSTALGEGHKVIALVRNPEKVATPSQNLKLVKGSIIDYPDVEELLSSVDFVICMLGDADLQRTLIISTLHLLKNWSLPCVAKGVKRILYQAGGFYSSL